MNKEEGVHEPLVPVPISQIIVEPKPMDITEEERTLAFTNLKKATETIDNNVKVLRNVQNLLQRDTFMTYYFTLSTNKKHEMLKLLGSNNVIDLLEAYVRATSDTSRSHLIMLAIRYGIEYIHLKSKQQLLEEIDNAKKEAKNKRALQTNSTHI